MPLMRFDVMEGRSKAEITTLLDAAHRAMLTAFKVPARDRYQIVHEHPPEHFIVQDTGLDIPRTHNVVVVTVTSRPRTRAMKETFYAELCRELKASCGIEASDVMVSIVTNTDEDWSFGHGRGQFLTGEL
ncbi:tautomerase family protein [Dyella ginsengisoli]|uniref:Tautomerase family protein n=1 Tax=Dyella ginsengisoli TaxID=363848 RepID=A0ABW8JTM9_9GAMM